ncbi:MAG: PEP/pyruvate-binding domain-containing protein [Polyangiaceae bacterium]
MASLDRVDSAFPALSEKALALLSPLRSVGESTRPAGRLSRKGDDAKRMEEARARFGGKAATLAELARRGLPVPEGWVIDAKSFHQLVDGRLPRNHDVASLLKTAGTTTGMDRAARARDRILADPLPDELRVVLAELWNKVQPHAPWGLSVRSSATCEDARGSSLAGLATSILGVRGVRPLEDAIRQVWASLYLPRTLLYLHRWGIKDVAMPVLFMPMVRAKAAGVLFTGPPPGLAGARWSGAERLVHATLGLGAPVVDGASFVDTYRLSTDGALLEQVIVEKSTELVVAPDGPESEGTVSLGVETERALSPALTPAHLAALADLAKQLAPSGEALDVEFAVDASNPAADRVVVLQARPVTGGLFPDGGEETTVWSRANVGEALPGAATPLTWSVARRFSDAGFRAAFSALGCHVPKGLTLVSNVYGRFYLNLSAFMEVAGQVPGLSPRALLEQSGGAPDGIIADLERAIERSSRQTFLLRAPFKLPSMLLRHVRLEREVTTWEAEAERKRRHLAELDLSLLPDDALAQTLTSASEMLTSAGELMLTTASASLAAHLALTMYLGRVLKRRDARGDTELENRREAARIAQSLSGGIAELESANPGLALLRVANIARRDPDALEILELHEPRKLEDLPLGPTRAALLEFLSAFGDRAVREAELSTPRWSEDPSSLLSMLRASLRGPEVDPDAGPVRARALADREMARLEASLGAVAVAPLRVLVARAQLGTRLRERMRAWVTRALGMIRAVALDIDRRLRHIDPSLLPESVFFCTFEELVAALRTGRAEIAHIIRLRRAEYLRDAARPDPPATFVGRPPPVSLPPSAAPRLEGLAASPGVVEGPARVVGPGSDAATALCPGEILVARATDIGMSPLFLVAAGIVTELGGPLSHAAIVAREYNVPAVVNVDRATLSIRTGERLRVDGDRGIVERLDAPPKRPSLTGAASSDAGSARV